MIITVGLRRFIPIKIIERGISGTIDQAGDALTFMQITAQMAHMPTRMMSAAIVADPSKKVSAIMSIMLLNVSIILSHPLS